MASADILRAVHSPLPFEGFENGVFAGHDCIAVCDTEIGGEDLDDANADFIVRACNAHYQMLEALKEAASALDEQGRRTGLRFPSTEEVIRAAIAAAEAEAGR